MKTSTPTKKDFVEGIFRPRTWVFALAVYLAYRGVRGIGGDMARRAAK